MFSSKKAISNHHKARDTCFLWNKHIWFKEHINQSFILMAWETFQQCKSLSFFWKGKGRQTSEKKYWFESNSKERWNVTRVALHTSFLKGKGAALWNRLLLRWWKKLNISHKKKPPKKQWKYMILFLHWVSSCQFFKSSLALRKLFYLMFFKHVHTHKKKSMIP